MNSRIRRYFPTLLLGLIAGILTVLISSVVNGCIPPAKGDAGQTASAVEAGQEVIDGTCKLIEGVTQNQTAIALCATAEEISRIVSLLAIRGSLVKRSTSEPCATIPTTQLCATKREIGDGILYVLDARRGRYLRDAAAE